MATIVIKQAGESEESLISKFRRKVMADNILLDLKDREYYRPPSVIKKERKKALGKRRR